MDELTCPHCHGNVPRGATVCRGCQAEVEYGTPRLLFGVLMLVALVLGVQVDNAMGSTLGWAAGVGIAIGSAVLLNRLFANRVIFKRRYRTR